MILVTGDVVLDHNIYEGTRLTPDDKGGRGSLYQDIPGGALLTYGLLKELGGDQVRFGLAQTTKEELRDWPGQFHTSAIWHLAPNGKKPEDGKHWALDRQLGYGETESRRYPATLPSNLRPPEILVLDDAGLGFRQATKCWPPWLRTRSRPSRLEWVILKMSRPLASGDLWKKLKTEGWLERLILIISSEQLRNEGLRVAGGLSWETTAIDIVRELGSNPDLRPLTECRHLIVTMGGDAALWIDSEPDKAAYRQLIFDRERCEGEWDEDELHKAWKAYGYQSAITASVAWFLSQAIKTNREAIKEKPDEKPPDPDDFTIALAAGLSTTRFLRKAGHGPEGKPPMFPFHDAATHLASEGKKYNKGPEHSYACAGLEGLDPAAPASFTILGQVSDIGGRGGLISYEPARRVACLGPDKLRGVPCATFEKLLTFDRREIDSLRYLRQLMLSYRDGGPQKRPLCLAVFGAPGSGKSFGLKQIAEAVFSSKNPILEFNLSQYSESSDLIGAYHQVRDKVLQGFTPVVFWDEFDSARFRWLQYFLAPMQDCTFQQGEVTHTIGKCVFVFAGGTSYTFESFWKSSEAGRFRLCKGPDFVSRLAGFLDIAGPNRRLKPDGKTEYPEDHEFPIRRALIMRSVLEIGKNEVLRIEGSLLNALVAVTKYRNGARSLEKLVAAIRDRGGLPLRRAHLPPDEVLSLYVEDVAEFHGLMERFQDKAGTLAPLIHQKYLESLTAKHLAAPGGRPLAREWDESNAELTDPNLIAARRIPDVLAVAGYKLEEGVDGDGAIRDFPKYHLELMAEAEHRGWEENKRIEGWSYWRSRNDMTLRHTLLKPYQDLAEEEKDLDRKSVCNYPSLAREVGFHIVRLHH